MKVLRGTVMISNFDTFVCQLTHQKINPAIMLNDFKVVQSVCILHSLKDDKSFTFYFLKNLTHTNELGRSCYRCRCLFWLKGLLLSE